MALGDQRRAQAVGMGTGEDRSLEVTDVGRGDSLGEAVCRARGEAAVEMDDVHIREIDRTKGFADDVEGADGLAVAVLGDAWGRKQSGRVPYRDRAHDHPQQSR